MADGIIHDAEHYIPKPQKGELWATEDTTLDRKLAELKKKHSTPPNIVYILWDDTAFGAVGFPGLQKNFGYSTPNINRMAAEGIPYTGLSNARPETRAIGERVRKVVEATPFDVKELLEFEIPGSDDVSDWGNRQVNL